MPRSGELGLRQREERGVVLGKRGRAHLPEALFPARVQLLDERDLLLCARAFAGDLLAERAQPRAAVQRDGDAAGDETDDEKDDRHQDRGTLEKRSDGAKAVVVARAIDLSGS